MGKNNNRLWRKVRTALIAVGAVSTFVFSGNTAKAASFGHVHTSACYGTVTKTCNDYRQWTEYTSMDYHCPNCLVITPHKTRITWLICNNDLVPNRDVAYYQECSKCGRVRKNDNPEGHSHEHDYTVTDLVCGKTESTTAATISASVDNTGITSGNVTIRANVSVLDSGFSLASAPYNFGYGYTSNPSFEVTKNGTYTVSVMDSNGRVASTSVTVNSIDRDAPVISAISKDTEDWSESGVWITVSASDGMSGLAANAYSFDGGDFSSTNTYHVTENKTVSVRVKDAVGNVANGSITIKNVGRDPEVVAREKAEAEERARQEALAKKAEEERIAAEKAAAEKAEAERIAAEKAEAERLAMEKAAAEKAALEKAEAERLAAEKAALEKAEAEKKAAEQEAERAERERESEREASEREASEREASERAAAERAASEKAALEKAAAEKAAADNAAAALMAKLKEEKEKAKEALDKLINIDKASNKASNEALKGAAGSDETADSVGLTDENKDDEDISENEILALDGKNGPGDGAEKGFINVTDMTDDALLSKGESTIGESDLFSEDVIESFSDLSSDASEDEDSSSNENLPVTLASVGTVSLKVGMTLLGLCIIFFSFFNYIYISENGHVRLVTLCKAAKSKDGKTVTVTVKRNHIHNQGRYCIYFCPWMRIGLKKRDVKVVIEGENKPISTDERTTFVY